MFGENDRCAIEAEISSRLMVAVFFLSLDIRAGTIAGLSIKYSVVGPKNPREQKENI